MNAQLQGKRFASAALIACASVMAQAAPIKSNGSANASATGSANASSASVLNASSATANVASAGTKSNSSSIGNGNSSNGNGNGNDTSGSSNSTVNSSGNNASSPLSGGSANSDTIASNGSGSISQGSNSGTGAVATPSSNVLWSGSNSDVTYAYDAMVGAAAANDFYGLVSGNDSKGIDELGLSWGNGWTLVARDNTDSSDDVRSTWQGISFTVDAGAKSPAGSWSLTGSGGSLAAGPVQLDMVAVVKSSTVYALYYFEDIVFDGSASGTWLSPAFNSKGVQQDLSHLSVYLRMGDPFGVPSAGLPDSGGMAMPAGGGMALPSGSDVAVETGGSSGSISGLGANAVPVPEPGSLALVAAALAAMAATHRRVMRRSV